jgi:hypothetical protein
VVFAVKIAVLAMQNCLAKGQGLECIERDIGRDRERKREREG